MSGKGGRIRAANPPGRPRPSGYSNAVIADGRLVAVAGQVAFDAKGRIAGEGDLVAQFSLALDNLGAALAAAGAGFGDVVKITIYVLDRDVYRDSLRPIGEAYRARFGSHYPATTLVEVSRFFEEGALVEVDALAVIAREGGQ